MPVNKKTRPTLGSNRKLNNSSANTSMSSRAVTRRGTAVSYDFPKESAVPAATYESEIAEIVDTKTLAGVAAVDVHYILKDQRGKVRYVKQRYPDKSYHYERLNDALIDAGLPEGAPLSDAVGIREAIEVAYKDGSTIGSFAAIA